MTQTTDPLTRTLTTAGPENNGKSLSGLAARFAEVRRASVMLRGPLSDEDCQAQSMPEASPAKWHLAHATWFFEEFVLARFVPGYRAHHPQFGYLFNSYYNAVGPRHLRPQRGLLTRPSMAEVEAYRAAVDEQMMELLGGPVRGDAKEFAGLVEIGLHHEQQHQELLLTDVKHLLWCSPLRGAYVGESGGSAESSGEAGEGGGRGEVEWVQFDEGVRWIGHDGDGFAYDNEGPRHRVFLDAFELASRPVTNGEYLEFVRSGGYGEAKWWLDEGWSTVQREGWRAPLYWEERDRAWWCFTLAGMGEVALDDPVCHVSYFEADAYARWAGARLAREAEWEVAASGLPVEGNFVEGGLFRPRRVGGAAGGGMLAAMFGDVWEWTASPYVGYPGYAPAAGAIGEYNGKFMCNQWVLRGGSCVTAASHMRATYRNFFGAAARWQFSGIRLARDVCGAAGVGGAV